MCMTLTLSEPMTRAVASGTCQLEWSNFTECVVTYVVTRTRMRFSGVISTAVLQYVEVTSETRLTVYVPQLCLGLLVMVINGWLMVSLQGGRQYSSRRTLQRSRPCLTQRLIFSLFIAHCLHGAIAVYMMTSMVTSSVSSNTRYRNQSVECLTANSFLFITIISALFHHVSLVLDRLHSVKCSVSYRLFWTSSRVWTLIGTLWVVALVIGFLPLLGWRTNFQYCFFFYQYPKGYLIFVTTIYFIGLFVIASGYAYILMSTRKPPGVTFNGKCSRVRRQLETKLTTTVAVLATVAAILWTPLFLFLVSACPQCSARSDNSFILLGVFALVLLNALLCPVIYSCRIRQWRHIIGALVKHWESCKMRRRSGNFELRNSGRPFGEHAASPRMSIITEPKRITHHHQGELPSPGPGHGDILY